jgi:DNA-binding beta-propeller fold protein YncE
VDAATNGVLGRTALPGRPEAVAVGFGRVWVTNDLGTVSTLDPGTGAVIGSPISVGADTDGVSISSDAVWAVALYGRTLARIDPVSREVVTRVQTPGQASGVLVAGGSVWVSNYDLATVSRFDVAAGRFVRSYRVGKEPRGLAEAGGAVWIANQSSNSVSRITP